MHARYIYEFVVYVIGANTRIPWQKNARVCVALTNSGRIIACARNANLSPRFQRNPLYYAVMRRNGALHPTVGTRIPDWFMTRLSRNRHVMSNTTISHGSHGVLSNTTLDYEKLHRQKFTIAVTAIGFQVWNCARWVSEVDIVIAFVK